MKKEGKNGTLTAIKRLECVQTDPINIVHCNQHLVLHNRVADYKPAYLEELLYKDRLVFEYWCNEKSIVPIADFAYFRYRMQNPTHFHSPFYERVKTQRKKMKDTIAHVLSEIRKHGALSARQLEQKGRAKSKIATKVLNLLWDCGDLMIHHAYMHDIQTDENVRFIAPLDNLLWNRRMISEVFNFNYAWEVYKVPEKKIYCYYAIPILYGTRFIGRLDPKLDRQNKTIVINSIILEKESFDKSLVNEFAVAMQRFIELHDAHQVRIEKTQPKELKDTLLRKLS